MSAEPRSPQPLRLSSRDRAVELRRAQRIVSGDVERIGERGHRAVGREGGASRLMSLGERHQREQALDDAAGVGIRVGDDGSTGAITFTASGDRPASAAMSRSRRRVAIASASVGAAVSARSASVAASARDPRRRAGVHDRDLPLRRPCDVERTGDPHLRTLQVGGTEALRVDEHAARGIRDPSVFVPRVPEASERLDELLGAVVTRLVVGVRVAAVVARCTRLGARDEVHARTSAGEHVE